MAHITFAGVHGNKPMNFKKNNTERERECKSKSKSKKDIFLIYIFVDYFIYA